jgi:hypothetical protein
VCFREIFELEGLAGADADGGEFGTDVFGFRVRRDELESCVEILEEVVLDWQSPYSNSTERSADLNPRFRSRNCTRICGRQVNHRFHPRARAMFRGDDEFPPD